jgi:hypothetical protein
MTKNTQLPLTLELAEPKLIAGEVDIQLSNSRGTRSNNQSNSFSVAGILSDINADVQVDDIL